MPFVNRFASPYAPPARGPFAALRRHPVIVLSGAASGGILLGAFVAAQLLATPATKSDGASSLHAAAEIKPAPPIAETTGSASADCDRQTWPYLSRDCMKNGGVRVVSPDRPEQAKANVRPDVKPEVTPDVKAGAPQPAPVVTTPPAAAAVAVAPAIAEPAAAAPPPSTETTAAIELKEQAAKAVKAKHERIAKKAKRKPKVPARQQFDDDDGAFASNDDDVSIERRPARSPRIVQRWTERDYDVPEDRGEGRRRVTVIRRGGDDGNPFSALFGGFGD